MANALHRLAFEKPIYELEEQIAVLEAQREKTADQQEYIRGLKRELSDMKRRIFGVPGNVMELSCRLEKA